MAAGRRLVIEGASVVTLDPKLGDLPDADVLIEDDAIVAVGPNLGVSDAEVIDARGQIAIPGFANTHLHTWQHALRGVCADWTVKDYVRCWRIHLGPMYRPEDMYVGDYAGGLDALNAGVTLVVDYCHNVVTRDHAREALRGLRDSGVRALFGLAYTPVLDHGFAAAPSFEVENPDLPDHDSRIAFARQLALEEFASKDGLVTLAIVPQEIEIARTWEEVVEEFHSARELDAQISLHANQSLTGHRWEDVRKLGRADLLGPDILFVHCSFSADDELKMIADAGASVSVAAETEMQMGMGFPITGKLLELGVAPSLGVDITSNGSGDMFAQMRLALQVGRMLGDQPYYERTTMPDDVSPTTRQALEWATVNGAKGAGLGDVTGTLTPGKQADVVLIDGNHFNLIGWDKSDRVGTVVMQANAGNVGTVIVGGNVVKRDGAMVGVDPAEVRRQVEGSAGYVRGWADEHGGILPQPRIELGFGRVSIDGKRVAVLGTGANGAGVGAELAKAGVDVTLIEQWPAHVEKMRADGLRIEMPDRVLEQPVTALHLCEVAEIKQPFDVVLMLMKAYDTRWAAELIKPVLARDGLLAGVQNGFTADTIADVVGPERAIGCVIECSAMMEVPGVVERHTPPESSWFAVGSLSDATAGREPEIADLLAHAGRTEIVADIRSAKWMKLVSNASTLVTTAILGEPMLASLKHEATRDLMIASGKEALAAGLAQGYEIQPIFGLTADDLADQDSVVEKLLDTLYAGFVLPTTTTTILHDWSKGRRSEVDDINGAVVTQLARIIHQGERPGHLAGAFSSA